MVSQASVSTAVSFLKISGRSKKHPQLVKALTEWAESFRWAVEEQHGSSHGHTLFLHSQARFNCPFSEHWDHSPRLCKGSKLVARIFAWVRIAGMVFVILLWGITIDRIGEEQRNNPAYVKTFGENSHATYECTNQFMYFLRNLRHGCIREVDFNLGNKHCP